MSGSYLGFQGGNVHSLNGFQKGSQGGETNNNGPFILGSLHHNVSLVPSKFLTCFPCVMHPKYWISSHYQQANHRFLHQKTYRFNTALLIFTDNFIFDLRRYVQSFSIYLADTFPMNYYSQQSDLINIDGRYATSELTHGSFSIVHMHGSLDRPFVVQNLQFYLFVV